jgi:hypothetical protein
MTRYPLFLGHIFKNPKIEKEIKMDTNNSSNEKRTFPFGGILLVLGGLFLLFQQSVEFEMSGGVFFGALALFFILWGATTRNIGLLIPGGILSGMSVGVFLIEDSTGLIPDHYAGSTFLFSLALGFVLITVLGLIFTNAKAWWSLIVAGIVGLVATGVAILEAPEASALKPVAEAVFNSLNYLWPVVMVGLGLWIIFRRNEK